MGSAFPFFRLRDLPLPGRSIFFRSILNKSIPKNTPHSTHNPKMTEISPLQKERAAYQPKLPTLLSAVPMLRPSVLLIVWKAITSDIS